MADPRRNRRNYLRTCLIRGTDHPDCRNRGVSCGGSIVEYVVKMGGFMKKEKLFVMTMVSLFASIAICYMASTIVTNASVKKIEVSGKVYVLSGSKNSFSIENQNSITSAKNNTYGKFMLSGNIKENGVNHGVPSYDAQGKIDELGKDTSEIDFLYASDKLSNADNGYEWKMVSDDSKQIDGIDLGGKAGMGCIVVQSSFDQEHWMINSIKTDAFKDTVDHAENPLYTTVLNQLINGCYYRVTVGYQTRRKTGESKFGGVKLKDNYEFCEHIERYEFFIVNTEENEKAASKDDTPIFRITSEPVNAGVNNEYSAKKEIDGNDKKRGCKIGEFYINGYSGHPHYRNDDESKKENPIFLKNVGDKVTLWFSLSSKDINALNGDSYYKIHADEKGADRDLDVPAQNFKRGALIIRFKDYENNTHTQVYTDYLAAASTTTADTKVQLFEEGDYEVALDYEIEDSSPLAWKIPKPAQYNAYRIYFKFSIRNANCIFYPIDLKTGNDLKVPYTENGFRLDLAKSKYLDINVQREEFVSGGLDIRENHTADDQDEFSEEGIYVIKVRNEVTGEEIKKTMYIGSNNLLKAYARYGKDNDDGEYTIRDLLSMKEDGYIFGDDGSITAPEPKSMEKSSVSKNIVDNNEIIQNKTSNSIKSESIDKPADESGMSIPSTNDSVKTESAKTPMAPVKKEILVTIVIVIVVIGCVTLLRSKKRRKDNDSNSEA